MAKHLPSRRAITYLRATNISKSFYLKWNEETYLRSVLTHIPTNESDPKNYGNNVGYSLQVFDSEKNIIISSLGQQRPDIN